MRLMTEPSYCNSVLIIYMLSLFLYSVVYIINFAPFVEVWNNVVNIVDTRLFMISKVIKAVDF